MKVATLFGYPSHSTLMTFHKSLHHQAETHQCRGTQRHSTGQEACPDGAHDRVCEYECASASARACPSLLPKDHQHLNSCPIARKFDCWQTADVWKSIHEHLSHAQCKLSEVIKVELDQSTVQIMKVVILMYNTLIHTHMRTHAYTHNVASTQFH